MQVNSYSLTEVNAGLQTGDSANGPAFRRSHRIVLETSGGPLLIGSIAGMVQDQTGAAIPGVQIMAIEAETGYSQKTTTDDRGLYNLPSLPWGTYSVRAESRGFSTKISKPLAVGAGEANRVDVRLAVGENVGAGLVVNADPVPEEKLKQGSGAETAVTGGIHGIVLDANGAVPARITAVEEATKKSYATSTDSEGIYRFSDLPAGNYCTKFEDAGPRDGMPGTEFETSREMRVSPTNSTEFNMVLPAIPEKIVSCTESCVVHNWMPPTSPANFAADIYAAHNVIEPGRELWVDISLKNISGHDQFIRTENGRMATSDYQIYLEQQCSCPGPLLKQNVTVDFSKSAKKPNGWSKRRIKRGETFTEKVDLSKLTKLDRTEKYRVYVEYQRDLNDERRNDGKQWPIQSNVIVVEVMADGH